MSVSRNDLIRILRIGWISSLLLGALAVAAPASAEDLSCTAVQIQGAELSKDFREELGKEVGAASARETHVDLQNPTLHDVLVRLRLLEINPPALTERAGWDRAMSGLRAARETSARDDSVLSALYLKLKDLEHQAEQCLAGTNGSNSSLLSQRFEKSLPDGGGLKAVGLARGADRAKAQ